VAFGAVPVARKRRGLLGACGDGATADVDQRGGIRGGCLGEARARARPVDPRCGRAGVPRAAAGGAARGRRAGPRARGAIRGLAVVLRASGGQRPGRAGVRGPPVGRRGPARVHREHARLVGIEPDLRADARPAGARLRAGGMAGRPARGHDAGARAARRRLDAPAAQQPRRRGARGVGGPDRRASRGCAAVCARDRARARRPRRARRAGRPAGARWGTGRARCSREPQLAARRATGRARARGARPREGDVGVRRVVPALGRSVAGGRAGGPPRCRSGGIGPQAGVRDPRRPPTCTPITLPATIRMPIGFALRVWPRSSVLDSGR
jgi:hypothetical protein